MDGADRTTTGIRLRGWKEIARYLRADERTVRRWERRGMPIHRLPGSGRSAIYADAGMLDQWLRDRSRASRDEPLPQPPARPAGPPSRSGGRRTWRIAGALIALAAAAAVVLWLRSSDILPRTAVHGAAAHRTDPRTTALVSAAELQNARGTSEGFGKAIALAQQALKRDPDDAAAYAAIAFADIRLPDTDATVSRDEAYRRAQAAAQRALDLDGQSWRAHSVMGFIEYGYNWNFAEGIRHFREVIRLNPNRGPGHNQLGIALLNMGDRQGALAELKVSSELEVANPIYLACYAQAQYVAGDKAAARATWRQILADNPNLVAVREMVADDALASGDYAEALGEEAEIARLRRDQAGVQLNARASRALATGGPKAMFAVLLESMKAGGGAGRTPLFALARIEALQGDKDDAFTDLQGSLHDREPDALTMRTDPLLASLRNDPRFEPLAQKYGITPASARSSPVPKTV